MHFEYPVQTAATPVVTPHVVLGEQDLTLARHAANITLGRTQTDLGFGRETQGTLGQVVLASKSDTLSLVNMLPEFAQNRETQPITHSGRTIEFHKDSGGIKFVLDVLTSEHVAQGVETIAAMRGLSGWLQRRRYGISREDVAEARKVSGREVSFSDSARKARGRSSSPHPEKETKLPKGF